MNVEEKIQKPVIRRIGIVPDPPKPPRPRWTVTPVADVATDRRADMASASAFDVRDRRDARTQAMPAIPDDIFATFTPSDPDGIITGPIPSQPLGAVPGADPLAHLRADPPARRWEWPVDPRFLLSGGAGVLVVGIIVLVAALGGNMGGTRNKPDPATATQAVQGQAAAATSTFGGTAPSGLSKVGSGTAAKVLAKAGQTAGGSVVEAWTWKDDNGSNLVVSTIKALPGNHAQLQVIHLAHIERDSPEKLRIMREPSLPRCTSGGSAGFTKNSLLVRDLNGDDIAEVAAGWSSRCGTAKASEVRLALITNGDKYIIRGDGVIGGKGGKADPDPKPKSWPKGYLTALQGLFRQLYF